MGKKRLKINRFSIKDFDMAHYRTTDSYTKAVDKLFAIATNEITNAASKADFDPDKPFSFDDYPKVKAQMQKTVASLTSKVQSVIETGSRKQWLFSCKKNDAFIKSIFDTSKLKKSELKQMTDKCLDALYAFQARKVAGMNLSQRVWKYTDQFREQIEHALDVGLGEGRSAQELSRDVRQNLNDPNVPPRKGQKGKSCVVEGCKGVPSGARRLSFFIQERDAPYKVGNQHGIPRKRLSTLAKP